MPKFLSTLVVIFLLISSCSAQKNYKYSVTSKKAISHFQLALRHYDYSKHLQCLAELKLALKADPDFVEARTLMGDTYVDLKKYEDATKQYKLAIQLNADFFPRNYLNLAKAEMKIHQFDSAIVNINEFLSFDNISEKDKAFSNALIQDCEFGSNLVQNPVPFNPINLGENINTANSEYHPSISVDEQMIVFTRLSPNLERNEFNRAKLQEDFYVSRNDSIEWQQAVPIGPPINTKQNEGAQCITPGGNAIYFTACNRIQNIGGTSCDIYYSQRVGETWTKPFNLGEPVNSERWDSQPSIASDGITLYFNSARSGKGKQDLWKSVRDKNGNWSEPANLGDVINTPGNEMSPFIHPDGKTLYFASDGHRGLGGTDLFISRLDKDGNWSTPKNLGYPINTAGEEKSLVVSASGETAYYASDREGGMGSLDLYKFALHEEIKPSVISFLKGTVYDALSKEPVGAYFEVINLNTGNTEATTSSDITTGAFLISLPTENDYALNVTAKGYLFYSENFSLSNKNSEINPKLMEILLKKVKVGESIVLKNIFFEIDSYELTKQSIPELEKLHAFLLNNPTVKIEIGGHTDNTGSETHNQKLSENRAKAVHQYLISKSIDSSKITFKGYGSSHSIADNSTEPGRAKNRRTEFKILK